VKQWLRRPTLIADAVMQVARASRIR